MKLRSIVAVTSLCCLAVLLVGCSSDSKSSSTTTTTPKDAVCADKSALESSVKALTNPDLLTSGTSSIKTAVKKVKTNLDALRQSVKADLKPQVDAVKSALDQLQAAVDNVGSGSLTENLQAIGDAISKVGATAGDLESALQSRCPSN
ncbi:MAG: hypothetical protein ACXVJW_10195 [Acidimicrobiia bacterium]